MTSGYNEYEHANGQTMTIQFNESIAKWNVSCWNEDNTNHWTKNFSNHGEASAEFNRWRA